jgi:hypothetical protein
VIKKYIIEFFPFVHDEVIGEFIANLKKNDFLLMRSVYPVVLEVDEKQVKAMESLIKHLEGLRQPHYECLDDWESCPKTERGSVNSWTNGIECNCGADEKNKTIDEAIELIKKLIIGEN